jgi:hypothetical protein
MSELDETAPSLDILPIFLTTIFVRLLSESPKSKGSVADSSQRRGAEISLRERHNHTGDDSSKKAPTLRIWDTVDFNGSRRHDSFPFNMVLYKKVDGDH